MLFNLFLNIQTKVDLVPEFYFINKNTYLILYIFRSKWNYRTSDGTKKSLFTPTKSPTIRGIIHNIKTRCKRRQCATPQNRATCFHIGAPSTSPLGTWPQWTPCTPYEK